MSNCKLCSEDLTIELDPEDFDEASGFAAGGSSTVVPDDLQLIACTCHFHWQCLLDESPNIFPSLLCPACNTHVANQQGQVLTRYHNEGGVQDPLDIFALVKEEAYLSAHPSARVARAYLTLCAEGDVGGIVELLQSLIEDPAGDDEEMPPADILRYQDVIDGGKTGLHIALEKEQQETVWLLLWLASGLPTEAFPEEVKQAAQVMGAARSMAAGVDIRGLRDEQGRRAEQVAGGMEMWAGLLGAGVLRA